MEVGGTGPDAVERRGDIPLRGIDPFDLASIGKPAVVERPAVLHGERIEPNPIGADVVDRHHPLGVRAPRPVARAVIDAVAVGAVGREQTPAAFGERRVDRSLPSRRLERFQPRLDVAKLPLPVAELVRTILLDEEELHQHSMPLRGEAVGVDPLSLRIVPPGGGVHVVVGKIEAGRLRHDREVGGPVLHQRHAEHHGIRRAVGRAQRHQQPAEIHVPQRLPLEELHLPHLLGERLERVARVWGARDDAASDRALMAGEAAHRPLPSPVDDILERPRGIERMRGEAIAGHRHPPPLPDISRLGLRFRRLLPHLPKGIEHFLIEVGGEVGPVEEMVVAGRGRRRRKGRFVRHNLLGRQGRRPGECSEDPQECCCGQPRDLDAESTFVSGSVHGILWESAHTRLLRKSGVSPALPAAVPTAPPV